VSGCRAFWDGVTVFSVSPGMCSPILFNGGAVVFSKHRATVRRGVFLLQSMPRIVHVSLRIRASCGRRLPRGRSRCGQSADDGARLYAQRRKQFALVHAQ